MQVIKSSIYSKTLEKTLEFFTFSLCFKYFEFTTLSACDPHALCNILFLAVQSNGPDNTIPILPSHPYLKLHDLLLFLQEFTIFDNLCNYQLAKITRRFSNYFFYDFKITVYNLIIMT